MLKHRAVPSGPSPRWRAFAIAFASAQVHNSESSGRLGAAIFGHFAIGRSHDLARSALGVFETTVHRKEENSESALRPPAEPVAFIDLDTAYFQGDAALAENLESPHYETLEERIAADLWRWRALPKAERAIVCANQSALAGAIEFYLCRLFELTNSSASSSWWCDGVFELDVSQRAERHFLLFGAAYWAEQGAEPFYLAPFELEFEFAVDESRDASRIVARFGRLDEYHRIVKTPHSAGPGSLVARRPDRDQDWAFAVELS